MIDVNTPDAIVTALADDDCIEDHRFVGTQWLIPIIGKAFLACHFVDMQFQCDELQETIFNKCVFDNCTFSSINLKETRFTDCQFYNKDTETSCNFNFANLTAVEFVKCDLSMCNSSRTLLYRA